MAGPTNTQFAVAVHLMTLLSAADAPLASPALAGSVGTNPVHVRRVLGRLREAGLVTSRPGVAGGWQVAVDPATTGLDRVWRAVHGDEPVLGVHDAHPDCAAGQRIQADLVALDRDVLAVLEERLAATTIADLGARVPPLVLPS
jgi:DNA-binding IscR family transcriptional regulator